MAPHFIIQVADKTVIKSALGGAAAEQGQRRLADEIGVLFEAGDDHSPSVKAA